MEFIKKCGSGWSSVGIGWGDMILLSIENPRNLGQSECDQILGKIEWVLSLYDKMRRTWNDVYLLWDLLTIYFQSLCPPLLPWYHCTTSVALCGGTLRPWLCEFGNALGDWDRVNWQRHLEAKIEWIWWCTWRLTELRDALGGHDWASLGIYLEAEIEWTQRYTWKPWLSEFGEVLGDWDWVNLEMHLDAVIEHGGRFTWRLWLIKIGRELGGGWPGGNSSEGG